MPPRLNKDTQLCMSLAGRPGNFGTRFHNYLYELLGMNYVYKAFTTQDLPAAIGGVRAAGIHGCAVSMPFKEAVIALPAETPLIREARRQGKPVITGLDVIALQALEQFVLYTGTRPTPQQVQEAVAFARQG